MPCPLGRVHSFSQADCAGIVSLQSGLWPGFRHNFAQPGNLSWCHNDDVRLVRIGSVGGWCDQATLQGRIDLLGEGIRQPWTSLSAPCPDHGIPIVVGLAGVGAGSQLLAQHVQLYSGYDQETCTAIGQFFDRKSGELGYL